MSNMTSAGASRPINPPAVTSKDIMGGVKNRARLFTEAIMVMVFPVLLAILREGSSQSKMASAVAGATLMAGIVQFLVMCVMKTVNNGLCATSKILVHICVVLVMGLAAVIMNFIGLKSLPGYVAAMVILVVSSLVMLVVSWRTDGQANMSPTEFEEFKGSLEALANFSAAVTSVLFLCLEALALEKLVEGNLKRKLEFPLALSFATCGVGVFSMLLVSVHPLIYDDKTHMRSILQQLSVALGTCLCIVVYFITGEAVGYMKTLQWLSPSLVTPAVWFCLWFYNRPPRGTVPPTEKHEPASLELTKITFAAFLAVSVISTADTSIGDCSAFLCFTALAIMTGVQWRLMTHWKDVPAAVARAADVACFMSHFCMACAVIPFALLAAAAVKKNIEANCPSAAPLPSN